MPSTKEYKGKHKSSPTDGADSIEATAPSESVRSHRQRRRPGREPGEISQEESPQNETSGETSFQVRTEIQTEIQTEFEGIFDEAQPEHVVHPDFNKYKSSESESNQTETEEVNEDLKKSTHQKVHLEFPYSDFLRSRAPKAFELAETVVDEWMKDGDFEGLPVGHPLAQVAVGFGLKKAKQVEKKLEEKGVFAIAKIGIEFMKSKLNRNN